MTSDLVGRRLGKYEIQAEIGRGGMGTVYVGYDPLLDRRVAVKVLAPHLVWEQGFVERFLREARAAARLKHPNVITIYDVGQEGNWYYFVMEYVEGRTLADAIRTQGPVPPGEAGRILRPLADALDAAHRQGLIHRDIKSGNVLLGATGQVMLTDFGIARAVQEARLTTTGALVGTPEYMSPEQAMGEEVDCRTDLYSLGIMAYEMLSGRTPFGGTTPHAVLYKQVHEPPPPICQARPGLPPGVEPVLGRALAKAPAERYGTATEFVAALEQALAGEPAAAQPGPTAIVQPGKQPEPRRTAGAPAAAAQPAAIPRPAAVPPAASAGAAAAPPGAPARPRRRSATWLWIAGLLVLVVVAGGIAAAILAGQGGEGGEAGPPTNPAEVAVAAATRTSAPAPAPTEPASGYRCTDRLGCVNVAPGAPVRLGYVLVLSGPDQALGTDSLRGIEIAVADKDHIWGHPIELVGEDSSCTGEGGEAAAKKLARDRQIVAVVGPSCSAEARTATPILCEAGVAVVSPSSTAPDLTGANRPPRLRCFLRTAHNDQAQGIAAARFAREVLKVQSAATVGDGSPYSEALRQIFIEAFVKLGGSPAAHADIDAAAPDAGPVIEQVAASKPQLVYFPLFTMAGAAVTRQAREAPGLSGVLLMGSDGLFTADFLKAAGDAALPMFLTSPDLTAFGPGYEEFVKKYVERYGEEPMAPFHAHAYDAAMIILDALDQVAVREPDGTLHIPRAQLLDLLYQTRLSGLTGELSCTPEGDCGAARIAVYELTDANPDHWNPGLEKANNPMKVWP